MRKASRALHRPGTLCFMTNTTVSQYARRIRRDAEAMERRYRAIHPERQTELRTEIEATLSDLQKTFQRILTKPCHEAVS